MAIAVVTTKLGTFGGAGGTTTSANTTGANLIVIGLSYQQSSGANISDNKGNTYISVSTQAILGGSAGVIYYCSNPTVGTGHTFTTTSHFCNIFMLAVSGARTLSTPSDQQNGASNAAGTSQASGNVTTSVSGELIFTLCGAFNPGAAPTITAGDTGFTIPSGWSVPTSTAEAGAAAYKIETGTATENITWTSTSTPNIVSLIATFMPPAVASPNSPLFLVLPF